MWSAKKIWFQLHWLIGISAGTMLVVLGLSGAIFSFHEEILDALNPGIARSISPSAQPVLEPAELLQKLQSSGETRRIDRLAFYSEPGRHPQITFAPPAGERRGTTVFIDPHTGTVLPTQAGAAFFDWVERLHRWLLLPIDIGKPIAGSLALCLLILSFTGLYLRWPSKPLSWRTWLVVNTRHKGRPFLWSLHAVMGTWALVVYLMFAGTGVYWGFNAVRSVVDGWAGVPARAPAVKAKPSGTTPAGAALSPLALHQAWQTFSVHANGWQYVSLQLPKQNGQPYQFSWYGADAPHERARNQLNVDANGSVQRNQKFADLPTGRRAIALIYPLHLGSYFGLPGRIIVTLASLLMLLFAVTGWILYIGRRRKFRACAQAAAPLDSLPVNAANTATIAVVHASQSGHAQQLAHRTGMLLRGAGHPVDILPIARLDLHALAHYRHVLWVVSTFGDGGPPDVARHCFKALQTHADLLRQQPFGVLALGDKNYDNFCGFGLRLQKQLIEVGAQPLFDAITMDGESTSDWQRWCDALDHQWHTAAAAVEPIAPEPYRQWQLTAREHLNPGSLGNPLFRLHLCPVDGFPLPTWEAGALVEVLACNAPQTVQAWLAESPFTGEETVANDSLRSVLTRSGLPQNPNACLELTKLVSQLRPIAPRRYSIASLPEDGHIALWVRQSIQDGALGLASGWLTKHLSVHGSLQLRLVPNPGFAPAPSGVRPAIFIGNGSGYAGLRAQLLARTRNGQFENWFIFGERQQSVDHWAQDEIRGWLDAGQLAHADFAYSRDAAPLRYAQHIVRQQAERLQSWINRGGVLYVCGSYQGMASDVEQALTELLGEDILIQLSNEGRYLRDVY